MLVDIFIAFISYKIAIFLLFLGVLVLSVYLFSEVKRYAGVKSYIISKKQEKAITKALVDTKAVNVMHSTPFLEVPAVLVSDKRSAGAGFAVRVEKLSGMYQPEKIREDISSSFRGKLSNFVVTSYILSPDNLFFEFMLEDVSVTRRWTPASLKEFFRGSHCLKLQENLEINLADKPHLIIWGKSGSGKTTLLYSIILQLFAGGADVRFLDGKQEFSSFSLFYPKEKIVNDKNDILNQLKTIIKEIEKREKIVADEVKKQRRIGLRAYDLGFYPIVVLADEIGSIVAGLDSKEKKEFLAYLTQIVQKGRSVSVFAIIGTQSPKTDTTLTSDIRQQFSTKILLGQSDEDTQRMAFGARFDLLLPSQKFSGYYLTDDQPLQFFIPDLKKNYFNCLDTFEEVYLKSKS